MKSKVALEPAASIIAQLGGPDAVRAITKASRTRVYRWTQPKDAGGTGGTIPLGHATRLLEHARANKIDLTADDFIAPPKEGA